MNEKSEVQPGSAYAEHGSELMLLLPPIGTGLSYEGVVVRDDGLTLPDTLPYKEWLEIGTSLKRMRKWSDWGLADWLRRGMELYPDRYSQALDATDYERVESLRNAAYVSGKFPPEARHNGMSFSHHQEVAGLSKEDADALLTRAEEEGMTTKELRTEVIAKRKAALGIPPTWTVSHYTGEFVEYRGLDGWGSECYDSGEVTLWLYGRSLKFDNLDLLIRRLYDLRTEAQKHFGKEWPTHA